MRLVGGLQPRGVVALVAVTLSMMPALVSAQDIVIPSPIALHLEPVLLPVESHAETLPQSAPAPVRAGRGALVPLYVSFAALQALDAHSTLRGIRAGAIEQNPMLNSIASRPAALFALKAGVAASTILLADTMRGRRRWGSILLMAGLNSLYAGVVAHNYGAVRRSAS
jgi:hypothetical protein